ncbi:MAG TPA: QsdR family transcriptional regulator [Solirubrobacteraceae bacterium]
MAAAREQYLDGQRVDVTVVARELGLGRATIYRWFGSREHLLGEVIADELEALVTRKRREVTASGVDGVDGLLETFDQVNRALAHAPAVRTFVEQERLSALRLLTSSSGEVQPRAVACVAAMIEDEAEAGNYEPTADPETLAYAIVRLAEAFLYNDAAVGIRGDHSRLREVQAALLGAPRASHRRRTPPPPRDARPGDS